jgi:hypothetical protein
LACTRSFFRFSLWTTEYAARRTESGRRESDPYIEGGNLALYH